MADQPDERRSVSGERTETTTKTEAPSSVGRRALLSAEQAKKRLQAFCIQKKQSSAGGLKTVTKKPFNPLEEYDKTKPAPSKKSKKEMSEYERSRASLINMLEMKKEEDRKLALVRLGIPLSLVPGDTIVKGLTTKPMPTKAMPPIKNFLNPEEIEKLLSKAENMDFKLPQKEKEKAKETETKHRRHNNDDRDYRRSSNDRRYDSHRRSDRSDHYRNRRKADSDFKNKHSYDRSSHRPSSSSRSKSDDNNKKGSITKSETKSKVGEYVLASLYDPSFSKARDVINITSPQKTSSTINTLKNKEPVDMFENNDDATQEELNNDSLVEKLENEIKIDQNQESNEFIAAYNHFMSNKFIPLGQCNENFIEPQVENTSDILLKPENYDTIDIAPNNESNLMSLDSMKNMDIYSPEGATSNSDSVLKTTFNNENEEEFTELLFGGEEFSKFSLDSEKKSIESSHDVRDIIWNDIITACPPKLHSLSECYKVTSTLPKVLYCENINNCKCGEEQMNSYKKLLFNKTDICSQFCINDMYENNIVSRNWYPALCDVFKDSSVKDLISNWEGEDSSSLNQFSTSVTDATASVESNSSTKSSDCANSTGNISPHLSQKEVKNLHGENIHVSEDTLFTPDAIPHGTLDSEYEKFMEAVWPEITDNHDKSVDSPYSEKELGSNAQATCNELENINALDTANVTPSVKDCVESSFANNPIQETDINDKLNDEQWSVESDTDIIKNQNNSDSMSPTSKMVQRKGHAKISSRHKKAKLKKSPKKNQKKSPASSSSTDSDSTSSSSSSSSSSASSSESESSSSDSSLSSSGSSSSESSVSTISSSDIFSTDSSEMLSGDEEKDKKKKKSRNIKSNNRKLSKAKRKRLKILAKAKEIARKMKLKKKKRKLKEKVIDKKQDLEESLNLNDKQASINEVSPNKRKSSDVEPNNEIKKKRPISDSASTINTFKSDENVIKRHYEHSDYSTDSEDIKRLKLMQNESFDSLNIDNYNSIKEEKLSDDDKFIERIKDESTMPVFDSNQRTNFRQEIISAHELESDFLNISKSSDISIVKTEISPRNETILNKDEMWNNSLKYENLSSNKKEIIDTNLETSSTGISESVSEIHQIKSERHDDSNTKQCVSRLPSYKEEVASNWSPVQQYCHEFNLKDSPLDHDETGLSSYSNTDNMVYKIQTISSRNTSQMEEELYNQNEENYDPSYSTYHVENREFEITDAKVPDVSTRKISLDDRINMVLQFPGDTVLAVVDEVASPDILTNSKLNAMPEKGILISSNGTRATRTDPRLNRSKRVSYADGFVPGQDSDCETGITVNILKETKMNSVEKQEKKKRRSCGGHAYPCPETWPDYLPRWDRLPPPPPPPGSPPPDLCDRINDVPLQSVNSVYAAAPQIPPIAANIIENLIAS